MKCNRLSEKDIGHERESSIIMEPHYDPQDIGNIGVDELLLGFFDFEIDEIAASKIYLELQNYLRDCYAHKTKKKNKTAKMHNLL